MSVGLSVGLSVTHSFDDQYVAHCWPTWPCSLIFCREIRHNPHKWCKLRFSVDSFFSCEDVQLETDDFVFVILTIDRCRSWNQIFNGKAAIASFYRRLLLLEVEDESFFASERWKEEYFVTITDCFYKYFSVQVRSIQCTAMKDRCWFKKFLHVWLC